MNYHYNVLIGYFFQYVYNDFEERQYTDALLCTCKHKEIIQKTQSVVQEVKNNQRTEKCLFQDSVVYFEIQ